MTRLLFKGPPELVPPFAMGNIPALPGNAFRVVQDGGPPAVFIKIDPEVTEGASKDTAPVPFPNRRLLAAMEVSPVPP